jgi:MacB-like periplasmic core domain
MRGNPLSRCGDSSEIVELGAGLGTVLSAECADYCTSSTGVDGRMSLRFAPIETSASSNRLHKSAGATVSSNRVTAGYFDLLKIGLVAGRMFTAEEEKTAAPSVLVSESAARRLWPGRNPIGRVVRFDVKPGSADPLSRYQSSSVIGIVRDVVVNSIEGGRERRYSIFLKR